MRLQGLRLACAFLCVAAASPAAAEPVTLDLLLGLETFGRTAVDPTGRVAVFEERRARGDLPRYDLQAEGALRYARLYRWDVGSEDAPKPLISMADDAGYTMGPFSPDGRRLVLYRLRGDEWRLGILDLATNAVIWTSLSPETSAWGRSVEWLADGSLAVIAMQEGGLPSRLARTSRAQSRLPQLWSAMATGDAAYVSDGVGRRGAAPQDWRTLWRVDAQTGRSEPLSAGPFLDMEASPDGTNLALLMDGPALPPPDAGKATEVRKARALRLVAVETARTTDLPEVADISTSLMTWSPDSRALLVQTLAPEARLLSIDPSGATRDVTPDEVTPLAPTDVFGMPTARAGWLADRPLFVGERAGSTAWFFRDYRAEHPSIRDGGRRLWAATDYPDAVADLLAIARHRGWARLKVDGSEAFRREVWIQARREGLEVTGYRPRQRDRQAGGEPPPKPPPSLAADLETRLRQAGAVLKTLVPDAAVRDRLMAAARGRARDHERRRDRER